MKKVNRLEVIGDQGRLLTIWVPEPFEVSESLQDSGRTLKIFLNGNQQQPNARKTLRHDRSCPAYGNYQPPYEECNCGYESELLQQQPDPRKTLFRDGKGRD